MLPICTHHPNGILINHSKNEGLSQLAIHSRWSDRVREHVRLRESVTSKSAESCCMIDRWLAH